MVKKLRFNITDMKCTIFWLRGRVKLLNFAQGSKVYWPNLAAFDIYSFSIRSMLANLAAQKIWMPPYDLPSVFFSQSLTNFRMISPLSGIPETVRLVKVTISIGFIAEEFNSFALRKSFFYRSVRIAPQWARTGRSSF